MAVTMSMTHVIKALRYVIKMSYMYSWECSANYNLGKKKKKKEEEPS